MVCGMSSSLTTAGPPGEVDAEVAARVRALLGRERADIRELARMTGLPLSTLYRKVRGQREWRLAELYRVAQTLGVPVKSLLPDAPVESPPPR